MIHGEILCNRWSESGGISDDISAKSRFLTR